MHMYNVYIYTCACNLCVFFLFFFIVPFRKSRAILDLPCPSVQISDTFSLHCFSRTVRVTKLKLGTHIHVPIGLLKVGKLKLGTYIDNGLMYRVYQNHGQGPITLGVASFDRFYNSEFSLGF